MSTAASSAHTLARRTEDVPRFERVTVDDEHVTAFLSDGRIVSVPLAWSWRLERATPEQRRAWTILGDGRLVAWEEVDEHLSVEGFLHGTPAPRPREA